MECGEYEGRNPTDARKNKDTYFVLRLKEMKNRKNIMKDTGIDFNPEKKGEIADSTMVKSNMGEMVDSKKAEET